MKTLQINNRDINVSHEIIPDAKTNHVHVHIKFEASDKKHVHVVTIGEVDGNPLPSSYDLAALQRDVDEIKQKQAAIFEGKLRAAELAASLTE